MLFQTPRSGCGVVALLALGMVGLGGLGGCGGGGGGDASNSSGPEPLVAFVTSLSGTGNLSSWSGAGGKRGLAAADAVCQARAGAAGLAGTYVAWMSDANDDAYCRVLGLSGKKSTNCGQATLPTNAGPWVRTDGFPFSGTLSQLMNDNVIYSPLRFDEFGAEVVDGLYFTATTGGGDLNTVFRTTCTNWTMADGDFAGGGGTESLGRFWTDQFGLICSNPVRLACLGTGTGGSLPAFASAGKKVFATSVIGTGNLASWADAGGNAGLAAGDAICQARAASAGLAGTFKAWLSSGTVDAIDRLTSNGPWVRLDGVKLAADKADLSDGRLFSGVAMDDTGRYAIDNTPWTGTDSAGKRKPNLVCAGWRSALATDSGTWGQALLADAGWTDITQASCSQQRSLLCFQD